MTTSSPINKLIIPEEVEKKIRYLQNKFPSTEWSGVLFYTYEGDFEEKGITITCMDIYPMDLGNSTFTQYSMSEDVAAYIAQNTATLWDCELGLIHSHHSMPTFFSGTDLSTLQSEGNDTNNFVSLIVNNKGTYSAAITRKVQVQTTADNVMSYNLFGEENPINFTSKETTDNTIIQYFMLNIEKASVDSPFSYIDKRFEEIEEKKKQQQAENKSIIAAHYFDTAGNEKDYNYHINPKEHHVYNEPYLFDNEELSSQSDIVLDPTVIHHLATIICTASLIIDSTKLDLDKWIKTNMTKKFSEYFGEADKMKFKEYIEWVIPYLFDYCDIESLQTEYMSDQFVVYAAIAKAIYAELSDYEDDKNPYMQEILQTLNTYIYYE